jgi:hypothetical protein
VTINPPVGAEVVVLTTYVELELFPDKIPD